MTPVLIAYERGMSAIAGFLELAQRTERRRLG